MNDNQTKICCICSEEFTEYGNNPEPFCEPADRCCDDCNNRFVIPVRMQLGRGFDNKPILELLMNIARTGKLLRNAKSVAP